MIETIKRNIQQHLNQEVKVISKENRNKQDIFYGKISEIYSHVFIVKNNNTKKSYSYTDILSKDINITFM